jgi:ankyrin repeat protein
MEPYSEYGRTKLQEAIWSSDYKEAKRLIYNGANVRQLTKLGTTSLHLACQNSTYDEILVILLLDKDCSQDPNALDACSAGHLPLVRILWKYGVKLQERNRAGWNGFCYAVENGHAQIVYFLLHHYHISEDTKARLSFMKLTGCLHQMLPNGFVYNGYPLNTRIEWCKMVDIYFAVTESMISLPQNLEVYNHLRSYIEYFRQTRERVRAWFQVVLRQFQHRDTSRLIGCHLWNTRFECIPA